LSEEIFRVKLALAVPKQCAPFVPSIAWRTIVLGATTHGDADGEREISKRKETYTEQSRVSSPAPQSIEKKSSRATIFQRSPKWMESCWSLSFFIFLTPALTQPQLMTLPFVKSSDIILGRKRGKGMDKQGCHRYGSAPSSQCPCLLTRAMPEPRRSLSTMPPFVTYQSD